MISRVHIRDLEASDTTGQELKVDRSCTIDFLHTKWFLHVLTILFNLAHTKTTCASSVPSNEFVL